MKLTLDDYIKGYKKQDIAVLARSITLIESNKKEHKDLALKLLSTLEKKKQSTVIGISGTPGVGKSTFIEAFGLELIKRGKKLAVLAVDPTSEITGGSILGDKTRMNELSQVAFIRPSPSGKTLGGVANKTREAIQLCENFGFDYIFVETVGVGQSEAHVSKLVDIFYLLMQPGAGDDLQAIKRGILELADTIIVNKADGELLKKANITKSHLESSLEILRHKRLDIHLISALKGTGIKELCDDLIKLSKNSDFSKRRLDQTKEWANQIILNSIVDEITDSSQFQKLKTELVDDLINNNKSIDEVVMRAKKEIKYGN